MKTKEDASVKISNLVKTYTDDRGARRLPWSRTSTSTSRTVIHGVGWSFGLRQIDDLRMVAGWKRFRAGRYRSEAGQTTSSRRIVGYRWCSRAMRSTAHESLQQHGVWPGWRRSPRNSFQILWEGPRRLLGWITCWSGSPVPCRVVNASVWHLAGRSCETRRYSFR